MDVNGHLHATAALPLGKEPKLFIEQECELASPAKCRSTSCSTFTNLPVIDAILSLHW
jgi:hypothetical protein